MFGSNAQKVIREAACPPITVKKLPENLNFRRIVFATDYHELFEEARRLGADMVAVANYPDQFFQRILVGSVSEALVNHLDVPVLAIPVGLDM